MLTGGIVVVYSFSFVSFGQQFVYFLRIGNGKLSSLFYRIITITVSQCTQRPCILKFSYTQTPWGFRLVGTAFSSWRGLPIILREDPGFGGPENDTKSIRCIIVNKDYTRPWIFTILKFI